MRRRFRAFAGLRWAVVGPICTRVFAPQDACAKGPHDGDRTLSKTYAYRVAQALAKATKRWKIGNAGRPSAVRDWATTPVKNEQGAASAAILKVGNFRDSRISKSLIQGWDAAPDLTTVWPEGGKLDFS